MSMKQPVTQVRLTNIAVVRYRMGGKRFEIACFPNKVVDWRKKIETDINQVLQSHEVFNNVSKADIANNKELLEAFDTTDRMYICRLILAKGELQITETERKRDLEMRQREIVAFVVNMCVNCETRLPFPARMIENAMQRIHFAVHPTRSTKQQALELVRLLKEDGALPIERAQMRIRVSVSDKAWASKGSTGTRPSVATKKSIAPLWTALESEDLSDGFEAVMLIPPSSYRLIVDLVQEVAGSSGGVEIVDAKVDESDMQALDAIASGMSEAAAAAAAAARASSNEREEKKAAAPRSTEYDSDVILEGSDEAEAADEDDDDDVYGPKLSGMSKLKTRFGSGDDSDPEYDFTTTLGEEIEDNPDQPDKVVSGTSGQQTTFKRIFPDHLPPQLFPRSKVVYEHGGLSWSIGGDSSDEDYSG